MTDKVKIVHRGCGMENGTVWSYRPNKIVVFNWGVDNEVDNVYYSTDNIFFTDTTVAIFKIKYHVPIQELSSKSIVE